MIQKKAINSSTNLIVLPTAQEAQAEAFSDAATSGARVFLCHVYEQGGRIHLTFSLPFNLLLEMGRLNSPHPKDNRSNAEEFINRPIIKSHVDEIKKYLLETDIYILPPFIFHTDTTIKVFAFGSGAVKFGYSVIPSNVKLYVTDGQHRIKAIEEAILEKPSLQNDGATVLVIQETNIDRVHQDFVDCAKTKPIPLALLAAFDVGDILARFTRRLAEESVIFKGRIDKISRTVGKDQHYLFTMSQFKLCTAELLFGSSRKEVIQSRSAKLEEQEDSFSYFLNLAQDFYLKFANNNAAWKPLIDPNKSKEINLYSLRQERIDFSTVGFQIISKLGHHALFYQGFTHKEREIIIKSIAELDYSREAALWQNSVVFDDGVGNKKLGTTNAGIEKAFRCAAYAIKQKTGIRLLS
jgi:DGQHR domain-containing protein